MTAPKEITDLISSSGNNFHAKVARWFTDNGWHVVVSPYYMDQSQSKAREIDLLAEKLWPVRDPLGHVKADIAVRLFIECKFVATDAVFWFADKDLDSALELVCKNGIFRPDNFYTRKHHYLIRKAPEWPSCFQPVMQRLPRNEPFYKALNQALNAMVSMRGQPVTIHRHARHNDFRVQFLNIRWSFAVHSTESTRLISTPTQSPNQFKRTFNLKFAMPTSIDVNSSATTIFSLTLLPSTNSQSMKRLSMLAQALLLFLRATDGLFLSRYFGQRHNSNVGRHNLRPKEESTNVSAIYSQ
jgi:hypothetical protein